MKELFTTIGWFLFIIFAGALLFKIVIMEVYVPLSDQPEPQIIATSTVKVVPIPQPPVAPLNQPDANYELVLIDGDHETDTCWFANTERFNETIYIVYPPRNPDNNIAGTWSAASNTISLMDPIGKNIETVSHEVSHLVDTFMDKYDVQDNHYRAYMQGFMTWCVWSILQDDEMDFKFAN